MACDIRLQVALPLLLRLKALTSKWQKLHTKSRFVVQPGANNKGAVQVPNLGELQHNYLSVDPWTPLDNPNPTCHPNHLPKNRSNPSEKLSSKSKTPSSTPPTPPAAGGVRQRVPSHGQLRLGQVMVLMVGMAGVKDLMEVTCGPCDKVRYLVAVPQHLQMMIIAIHVQLGTQGTRCGVRACISGPYSGTVQDLSFHRMPPPMPGHRDRAGSVLKRSHGTDVGIEEEHKN